MPEESKGKGNFLKIGIVSLVLVVSGLYLYASIRQSSNGLRDSVAVADNRPGGPTRGAGGPGRGEGAGAPGFGDPEAFRARMRDELKLSDEQMEKIDAIRATYQDKPMIDRLGMFAEMRKLLTPDQQAKAQAEMQTRLAGMQKFIAERDAEAKKTLSAEDYAVYEKKREEMRGRFRAMGGPGGPGGFGPPPDGTPPPPGD